MIGHQGDEADEAEVIIRSDAVMACDVCDIMLLVRMSEEN